MECDYKDFLDTLSESYKERFNKLTGKNIEQFIYTLSKDFNYLIDEDLREIKLEKIYKNMAEIKRRWFKKVISGQYDFIDREIELITEEYKKAQEDHESLNKFQMYFNVENPEQYKEIIISNITNWKSDKRTKVLDFQYLDKVSKQMCLTAFKVDLLLLFNDYILKQNEANQNITQIPTLLSNLIIDTTNRNSLFEVNDKRSDEEELSLDMYINNMQLQVDADNADKLILELERDAYLDFFNGEDENVVDYATQIALLKSAKYMNALDVKIFLYYYNNIKNLVSDQPITMTLYNLEKELGLTHCGSAQTDDMVLGSLSKLANMRLNGNISGLTNRQISVIGTLLECTFYTKIDNGREVNYVSVKHGGVLQQFLLKKSTYEYNKVLFDSLQEDTRQIIIWLQKWRYKAIICGLELASEFNIMETSFGIYWRKARLDRKKKRIVAALEELKQKNIIVDSYEVFCKSIKVYYKNIDKDDLRVLANNGVNINELSKLLKQSL